MQLAILWASALGNRFVPGHQAPDSAHAPWTTFTATAAKGRRPTTRPAILDTPRPTARAERRDPTAAISPRRRSSLGGAVHMIASSRSDHRSASARAVEPAHKTAATVGSSAYRSAIRRAASSRRLTAAASGSVGLAVLPEARQLGPVALQHLVEERLGFPGAVDDGIEQQRLERLLS